MASIPVVELRRKLDLAVEYVTGSKEGLASRFDRSVKTVYGWVNDDRGRPGGSIPHTAMAQFVSIFADALPDLPRKSVQSLVEGPARHLQHELALTKAPMLSRIVSREGKREGVRLIPKSTVTQKLLRKSVATLKEFFDPLVEMPFERKPAELMYVALGEEFRLEFPARPDCLFSIVVQNAGLRWGAFRPGRSRDSREVLLPPPNIAGRPSFMNELEQSGLHLFVSLQCPNPFPAALIAYIGEKTGLDKRGLEILAGFYDEQPAAHRACHFIEIWVGEVKPQED